ncbi:MAG: sigma 54-interacting transcriptional regulator, partial [Limisphaerales bacterium]
LQAKLLRVLQERELERVGGNRTIKVDVRVIATTNRNLEESVEKKEFRQDLFFRLNVVPIHVPPLRDRREDVVLLAEDFKRRFARKHGVHARGFSEEALQVLAHHSWPGNVRELQNVVERAVILCGENGVIDPAHLGLARVDSAAAIPVPAAPHASPPGPASAPASVPVETGPPTLAELEKRHILAVLEGCKGNRTQAAKLLDISIRTLRNKLHEYSGTTPGASEAADSETVETQG